MNQILNFYDNNSNNDIKPDFKKYISFLKVQFVFSIFFIIFSIFYYFHNFYTSYKKEEISNQLADNFSLSLLYSKNNTYNTSLDQTTSSPFVIGMIKIDSLQINYPILSYTNDDLLEIAPCRFYGPLPNEVGNLCIAAHNYDDNRFFSKISTLKSNDIIFIYDYLGNCLDYKVYDIFEVTSNNMDCTSQDTNGNIEITLVTCNNINNNRIIVKAQHI